MIYVVLALIVCVIVIYFFKYRSLNPRSDHNVTNLVQCAVCGTYVERSECKNKNGNYICSDCQ